MNEFVVLMIAILISALGAYSHEIDMISNLDDGYVYTWSKGKIYVEVVDD